MLKPVHTTASMSSQATDTRSRNVWYNQAHLFDVASHNDPQSIRAINFRWKLSSWLSLCAFKINERWKRSMRNRWPYTYISKKKPADENRLREPIDWYPVCGECGHGVFPINTKSIYASLQKCEWLNLATKWCVINFWQITKQVARTPLALSYVFKWICVGLVIGQRVLAQQFYLFFCFAAENLLNTNTLSTTVAMLTIGHVAIWSVHASVVLSYSRANQPNWINRGKTVHMGFMLSLA